MKTKKAPKQTSKKEHPASLRRYRVVGRVFRSFDQAAGYVIGRALQADRFMTLETTVRGKVVETIDVGALLSIDPTD
jgi:hypothetical protein